MIAAGAARRAGVVLAVGLLAVGAAQATKRAAEWMDLAHHDARAGRHAEALAAVDSALVPDPAAFEPRLLRARIYSWQGRYAAADTALQALAREHPGHADVTLAHGYLRYYEGRHAEAAAAFRELLALDSGNTDAREGLGLAARALGPGSGRPPSPLSPLWRADAGGDYSTFTRRAPDDWNGQYLQLARRMGAAEGGAGVTMLHGRLERYARYGLIDWAVEAGAFREFLPTLRGSAAAGWSPDATFRPEWRLAADGEWRAWSAAQEPLAFWLTAGGRYDVYDVDAFLGLSPGARAEWGRGWALAARGSHVIPTGGGTAVTGWMVRGDGLTGTPALGPVRPDVRFTLGVADAPETESFGGLTRTVSTFTVFAGLGLDLTGGWGLSFGYARDDREGSWVRHVLNAGVSCVF